MPFRRKRNKCFKPQSGEDDKIPSVRAFIEESRGEPVKLPKPSVKSQLKEIKTEQDKKATHPVKEEKSKSHSSKAVNHKQPKTKKSKRKER